jgi:hypothetical protein
MPLRLKIPEDFAPVEVHAWKKEGERAKVKYWVYPNGQAKSYLDCSAEEAAEWANSIFQSPILQAKAFYGLAPTKAILFDLVLALSSVKHRNLFGGPELWEQIPEWQRMKRLQEKEKAK